MPITVNGIGTSYYGKKNLTKSNAVCSACHRFTQLTSYETGHYFVVLYIPIIPLGRKQIIDDCPHCMRHRVVPLKQWREIKQNAIARSTDELARNVDDSKAAREHLASLTAFGERAEATELAEVIASQHAESAEVQFMLGTWYEQFGDRAAADRCFEQAFRLEPKNPIYSRANALGLMEQGQLDPARKILRESMEPPSPNFDGNVYFRLATLYQKAGRDREALELFALVKDQHGFEADRNFRKAVARSERRSGSAAPLLDKVPFFRRRSFWWTALVATVLFAFMGFNWYLGQNQRLHVVNGLAQSINIQIDSDKPLTVPSESRFVTNVSEGRHVVRVLAPTVQGEPREFIVQTPLWTRLFRRPVLLLDPLRTCFIYWQEATYSQTPNPNDGSSEVRAAELFVQFPPVDYPFKEFPDSLEIDSRKGELKKTRVDFAPLETEYLMNVSGYTPDEKFAIAENVVSLRPESSQDLFGYYLIAKTNDALPRFQSYLSAQMTVRPVRIRIHELYQETSPDEGITSAELVANYDMLLQAEPNNVDLIYLRGRLESSVAESNKFFERALAENKDHRMARLAIASNHLAVADFPAAQSLLEKLYTEDQWNEHVQSLYAESLVANKEFDAAVQISWGKRGKSDVHANALRAIKHAATLLESPKAKRKDGTSSLDAFEVDNPRFSEPSDMTTRRFYLAYYKRDAARMKSMADMLVTTYKESPWYRFVACLDAGEAEAAEKMASEFSGLLSTAEVFMLATALKVAGKSELAENWWNEGLDQLRSQGRTEVRMAELLEQSRNGPLNVSTLSDLRIVSQDKRIYLLAVREFGDDTRSELADLIRKLNFDLDFPYYLIRDRLAK